MAGFWARWKPFLGARRPFALRRFMKKMHVLVCTLLESFCPLPAGASLGCQRDLLELVKPCFCILPFPPTSALQNVGKGCGFFDSSLACFEEGSLLVLAQVVSKVEGLTCRFAWDFGLLHRLRILKKKEALQLCLPGAEASSV